MLGIESGKPDPENQVINHLRFLQRAMDVTLVPESKRQVFVAGMRSLSFRGFLDRSVDAQTAWAFADSIDVDATDKANIDKQLTFSGRIIGVGYLQDQEADVDSIVVSIDDPEIEATFDDHAAAAYESDALYRLHRLHIPVLAIQRWNITRTLADELEIIQ